MTEDEIKERIQDLKREKELLDQTAKYFCEILEKVNHLSPYSNSYSTTIFELLQLLSDEINSLRMDLSKITGY